MYVKAMAALVALGAAAPARAEPTIQPGYWESTSETPFAAPKTDRRCITPEKVEQYLSAPSTSHYKCTYSKSQVHGGVADLVGQCKDKHDRIFAITLHGTYTPDSFSMTAQLSLPNLPLGISATTVAHRISATCPANP